MITTLVLYVSICTSNIHCEAFDTDVWTANSQSELTQAYKECHQAEVEYKQMKDISISESECYIAE